MADSFCAVASGKGKTVNRPIAIAATFLLSSGIFCSPAGAVDGTAEADHPSNGVVDLSAKPVVDDGQGHARDTSNHDPYGPWDGFVWLTIRNVSRGMVHLVEIAADEEYTFEVVDPSGKAVPLTELGKQERGEAASPDPHRFHIGSVSMYDLGPTQERSSRFNFAVFYQVRRSREYKIRIKRTQGLPTVDESGKPLKQAEVSCSVEIPAFGIPR